MAETKFSHPNWKKNYLFQTMVQKRHKLKENDPMFFKFNQVLNHEQF